MTLEKLLENNAEALKTVKDAIETANKGIADTSKQIKFVDLGEGEYVASRKFTNLETKYNDLVKAPNEFETKYNDLVADGNKAVEVEHTKLTDVIKKMAVDGAISSLGIKDKLTEAGIKSLIKLEDIKVGDDYNISDGLEQQINTIKETYKDSFVTPTVVSTSNPIKTSTTVNTARKYSSLAEIKALTQEEVNADIENISSQLCNLS